jgi:hypothetical protein
MLSGDHAIANMAKRSRSFTGGPRDRRVSKAVVARRWHAEVQSVRPMSPRRTCPWRRKQRGDLLEAAERVRAEEFTPLSRCTSAA